VLNVQAKAWFAWITHCLDASSLPLLRSPLTNLSVRQRGARPRTGFIHKLFSALTLAAHRTFGVATNNYGQTGWFFLWTLAWHLSLGLARQAATCLPAACLHRTRSTRLLPSFAAPIYRFPLPLSLPVLATGLLVRVGVPELTTRGMRITHPTALVQPWITLLVGPLTRGNAATRFAARGSTWTFELLLPRATPVGSG